MSRRKDFLQGQHLQTEDNITKKIITFQKLRSLVENNIFKKPDCQGALIEEKVNSMTNCYLKRPENFQYKNTIIVGVIKDQYYILDGQHRVEMCINLCKNYHKYNKKLIVAYYPLKNHMEAQDLFNEINIDSIKNEFYISKDQFTQIIINEFRNKLKDIFKQLFSKKLNSGKIKCIEEFVDELYAIGFLNDKTIDKAFEELMKFNKEYFKIIYKPCKDNNSLENLLYKGEIKSIIDNQIVFCTKQNNFIEFLKNKTKPIHIWKKNKKRITKGLRKKVWFREFNKQEHGICPIKHCQNVITKDNFQAGHIVSEFNGGPTELDNLRPICKTCNTEMGRNNWNKYDNC